MNFLVCIRCFTYNHASYIIETFEGFVKQKTSFPYVVMVVDDASTDGEQQIIAEYISSNFDTDSPSARHTETDDAIIDFVQHKQNRNCYFAVYYLKYNHYRKKGKMPYLKEWRDNSLFEAICEGDDFWTDPDKLQLQADFLTNNPDYSFCCHRYDILQQDTGLWLKEYAYNYYMPGSDLLITPELYSRVWVTQPLTLMTRREAIDKIEDDLKKYKYRRDLHMFYHLLKVGKGIALNRNMGVYRWHSGGISSSKKGVERYRTDYLINKEFYCVTKDPVLCRRYIYSVIHLIRFDKFSSRSVSLCKEIWGITSFRERINMLLSLMTPLRVIKFMTEHYSKKHIDKIQLN